MVTFLIFSVLVIMKYLIILFLIAIIYGCHVEKSIHIANGECITQRQFQKRFKRAYQQAMREMSKEYRKIMKAINISVET